MCCFVFWGREGGTKFIHIIIIIIMHTVIRDLVNVCMVLYLFALQEIHVFHLEIIKLNDPLIFESK